MTETTVSPETTGVREFDIVVIGAGPVGENAADRAVQGGLTAAIVESELVGGECSYWACMPSKALLRSGAARRAAERVAGSNVSPGGQLDDAAVLRRRSSFTSGWDDAGQVSGLESAGIELVRGFGRLSGERRVSVERDGGRETLVARHAVVIATGSAAVVPDIPGLAEARPWTNREAVAAETVPRRIAILGGGVVGSELATVFSDLGSEVTMLVRGSLLSSSEPFAGSLVAEALAERGVRIVRGDEAQRVDRAADGVVTATLRSGERIEADEFIVATGRTARTADVGLDAVGLDPSARLAVDDRLRVLDAGEPLGGGWLYAAGDANGRALLTHQGKYQARAIGDAVAAIAAGRPVDDAPWGAHVATADAAAVPQVVFTDPEVAAVGRTAAKAEDDGIQARVHDLDLGGVAGAALHADGYAGRARIVIDAERDVVIGMTLVGQDVAELIHAATIAVVGEVPLHRLWHAVPSYPTLSEFWLRLLEADGRAHAVSR